MIGIDTYSLQKLFLLRQMIEWKHIIEELIEQVDFFITVEGKKEFEYRFPEDLDVLNKITILPILNEHYLEYIKRQFDPTDASLLEYADLRDYRLITEDRLMLAEGITLKKNIVCLIDFFKELADGYAFFSKKELYHLVKIFRKWKNISKKKASTTL